MQHALAHIASGSEDHHAHGCSPFSADGEAVANPRDKRRMPEQTRRNAAAEASAQPLTTYEVTPLCPIIRGDRSAARVSAAGSCSKTSLSSDIAIAQARRSALAS